MTTQTRGGSDVRVTISIVEPGSTLPDHAVDTPVTESAAVGLLKAGKEVELHDLQYQLDYR